MKYQNNSFFILIIFFTFSCSKAALLNTKISNLLSIHPKRAWCWTKYTSGKIKSSNGGNNWGYCKSIQKVKKKVRFTVLISTSTIPGSATKSNVYLKFKGQEGLSKETILSKGGLKEGSYIKKEIVTEDVGSLKAIQVRIEGQETYRCNVIRVEYQTKYWNFECDSELISCPKCIEEIKLTNLIPYELNVKTRDIDDASTQENIYIRIFGENGKTPEKLISNKGFSKGSIVNVSVDSISVGLVTGISVSLKNSDNWMPEYVIIRYLYGTGNQEQKFSFPQSAILTEPDKPLVINLSAISSKGKSKKKKPVFDNRITKIIKLGCEDIVKGNDLFGPAYVTQQINYQNYIAYCPYNCYRMKVRTIGLGIHPEEAPICISALVDRAISFYGGYISLSILNGIDSYTGGKTIQGFSVLPFSSSMRSYTVTKINNIDLIIPDVRIIDFKGKPNYKGRLEMRFHGVWGTVCADGLVEATASVICKEQGYKKGRFLNPPPNEGRKFCSNFNGMDYCGAPQSRILYSKLRCQGTELSVFECYREIADKSFCTHEYDTLIECTNSTADESVYYEAGTVKLLNHKNENPEDGRGRLKIFLNGRWGTVCSKGFTDISARVACRQMGYISGKILKDAENRIVDCQNVFGNNMCADLTVPILIKSVDCEDKKLDQKLIYCPHDFLTSVCTHFDDVVLQCEGFGDPTGRSQNMKPQKVLKPVYKPLPMLPKYSAKCDSNAYQMTFRGDPGSLFLVSCPKGCTENVAGIVIGSGVYTLGSSICRAAIHSGAITNDGGIFILAKTYGQNNYQPGNFRGVMSINSKKTLSAFVVSRSLKIYEALSDMLNSLSFIELDKKTWENLPQVSRKYKPYFEWISPTNFLFDSEKNTYINLNHDTKLSEIPFQTKFTVSTKIEMIKFAEKVQTIFSIGGCNGYSLAVNDQTELIVDGLCGKNIYYSGIYIPIRHYMNIAFTYDSKKIIFYLNNKKIREIPADLKINYPRFIYSIGSSSESSIDIFNGKIEFLRFYNLLLEENSLSGIPQKRLGTQSTNQLTTLNKFYIKQTLDSRRCISDCMDAPIPGIDGSPEEPAEALKPDPLEVNDINSDKTSGNENKLGEILLIKCNTKASDIFKDPSSHKKRVKCPAGCTKFDSNIYGNIIYGDSSSVCKSAIHSGILRKAGGIFFVRKKEPLSLYMAKKSHGIQSLPKSSANFSFQVEEAPIVIIISCNTLANNDKFPEVIGSKYLVKCPENCDTSDSNIYGNNCYSTNSSICKSAIHTGIITKKGGEVTFMITPGKKSYLGTTKNGIKSLNAKASKASIRFFVGKTASFIKYKEQFIKGSLLSNWDVVDSQEALNGPSNWKIVKTKFPTKNNFIITQSSKIKLSSNKQENSLSFASKLLLKDSEFMNCLFRTFLYFEDSNPIGIILKYVDEKNYYAIILNNPQPYPMVFIKKQEGKTLILAMSRISLKQNTFYIFIIQVYLGDEHNIKVFLEFSDKKVNHLLFNIKDSSPIKKGGIGFATNGNSKFFITSILIDNFLQVHHTKFQGIEKRTFEQILEENTESGREKFCRGLSNQIDKLYLCMEAHNFCQLKCNESIPKRENVLNYHCYKSCVKDSKTKVIKTSNIDTEIKPDDNKNLIWSPRVKEKCDFKPEEADVGWVPCLILKVKKYDNLKESVFITYKLNNKIKTMTIIFPSPLLVKCGMKIKSRKDCGKMNKI